MKANLRLNLIVSNAWKHLCANQFYLTLYLKLHGTHRPNTVKKTVIKRQKRVPAAGAVTTGRMTDQAAAEASVVFGQLLYSGRRGATGK